MFYSEPNSMQEILCSSMEDSNVPGAGFFATHEEWKQSNDEVTRVIEDES